MITIIIQDKTMMIQDEERKTYDIHRKQKRNIKTQKRKAPSKNDSACFLIPFHLTCVPVLNGGFRNKTSKTSWQSQTEDAPSP